MCSKERGCAVEVSGGLRMVYTKVNWLPGETDLSTVFLVRKVLVSLEMCFPEDSQCFTAGQLSSSQLSTEQDFTPFLLTRVPFPTVSLLHKLKALR